MANCAKRLLEVKASGQRPNGLIDSGDPSVVSHKWGMANMNIQLFMVYPLQISPYDLVKNLGLNF